MKIKLTLIATLILLWQIQGFALIQVDSSMVHANCSYPYSCSGEEAKLDDRRPLPYSQPESPSPVQGKCSTIPRERSYLAEPLSLTCGSGTAVHQRGPIQHPQDKIDDNFTLIGNGHKEEAQKKLLTSEGWTDRIPFSLTEHWVYKRKTGGYENCAGRFGHEGGQRETYQTTCYRMKRKEKVQRRVITMKKTCAVFKEPPPPPPPKVEVAPVVPSSSGGNSTSRAPAPKAASPKHKERTYSPPPVTGNNKPAQPKGRGESKSEQKQKARDSKKWGYSPARTSDSRFPAAGGLRYIEDRFVYTEGSSGPDGCAQWTDYKEVDKSTEEVEDDVDGIAYSCMKERYTWCTWYVDDYGQQSCPEQKTATVQTRYVTPNDWNPSHPMYDDQLPNKFDLLYGELEGVKVTLNKNPGRTIEPDLEIKNLLPGRTENWNRYEVTPEPRVQSCEFRDINITLNIKPLERILQPAPNPLQIPRDENGNLLPFDGEDEDGRPKNLILINPARGQVLDRSNLSRIFGVDPAEIKDNPEARKKGGISKKFWENTRFWMRLIWMDGDTPVRVTKTPPFNINNASPEAEWLQISLKGENGIDHLYRLAVPFDNLIKWFGTEVSLDPNKDYLLEIKVAQPGFDRIYKSGLDESAEGPDEQKEVTDASAYSEALQIPLKAPNSKPGLWDQFWHYRSGKMVRP